MLRTTNITVLLERQVSTLLLLQAALKQNLYCFWHTELYKRALNIDSKLVYSQQLVNVLNYIVPIFPFFWLLSQNGIASKATE